MSMTVEALALEWLEKARSVEEKTSAEDQRTANWDCAAATATALRFCAAEVRRLENNAGGNLAAVTLLSNMRVRWLDAADGYREAGIIYADQLLRDATDEIDSVRSVLTAAPHSPQPAGCGACGDDCKDRGSCRLADESPKPAGAVPLPEVAATVCLTPDGYAHGHMLDLQVQVKPMETFAIGDRLCRYEDAIRYGDAREAAARGAVPANWNEDSSLETWFPYTAEPLKALEAENEKLRATGRADAVPAWFGELPAPISNPEAWPANYAGGYNDALNMCYDVIRGHAPPQMTTQGEADALLREVRQELIGIGCEPCTGSDAPMEDLHGRIADYFANTSTGSQP